MSRYNLSKTGSIQDIIDSIAIFATFAFQYYGAKAIDVDLATEASYPNNWYSLIRNKHSHSPFLMIVHNPAVSIHGPYEDNIPLNIIRYYRVDNVDSTSTQGKA